MLTCANTSYGIHATLNLCHTRQFSNLVMSISSAPHSTRLSMTSATFFVSTMTFTATHPSCSSGETVGARLPGVMAIACASRSRGMLYRHSEKCVDAMTPLMREVRRWMSAASVGSWWEGEEGFLEDMSTASVVRTVAIACRPAARIVSPDSNTMKEC